MGGVRRRRHRDAPWTYMPSSSEELKGSLSQAVRCCAVGAAGHGGARRYSMVRAGRRFSDPGPGQIKVGMPIPPMRPGTASLSNADHLRRGKRICSGRSHLPSQGSLSPCLARTMQRSDRRSSGIRSPFLEVPQLCMPIRHCSSAKAMARPDSGDDRGCRPWQ